MAKHKSTFGLLRTTTILGILVGLGAMILGKMIEIIEYVFLNYKETAMYPAPAQISPLHRLLSLVIGGMIATILWWYISVKLKPTVNVEASIKGTQMPVSTTLLNSFTQVFFVGIGGPVGREVAPRLVGTLIAQKWMNFLDRVRSFKIDPEDRQLLLAAAAGAGFAGIYIAPMTGMLFSVEILLNKVNKKTVSVSLLMSIIAMLMGSTLKGFKPYYLVGQGDFSLPVVALTLIIAPISGICGALFRKGFKWAERTKATKNKILWQLPLISLITGLIAMYFPEIMGNGRSLAEAAIHIHTSKVALILLIGALAKSLVTTFSLKAGAFGGKLAPSIAIGAAIGGTIGFIASLWIPGMPIWQCAVIGASALLAASQQAPLMALFMMFEICHLNYSAFLPLGLGVALAILCGKLILKDPVNK